MPPPLPLPILILEYLRDLCVRDVKKRKRFIDIGEIVKNHRFNFHAHIDIVISLKMLVFNTTYCSNN